MRINSKKQTEASRSNGAQPKRQRSAQGKQRSRLNALSDGIFTKELVLEAAGERMKDFEEIKASIWDYFQPEDILQEILAADVVENWWRRQRVRRCESAALRNRLDTGCIRERYRNLEEIESLKVRFLLCLGKYTAVRAGAPGSDLTEVTTELENARQELASTSLGLEFLIKIVSAIQTEAASKGQMSDASEVNLRACVGFADEFVADCLILNSLNKREAAKAAIRARTKPTRDAGQSGPIDPEKAGLNQDGSEREAQDDEAGRTFMLVAAIKSVARELSLRRSMLKRAELWEEKTRLAAAVLPPDGTYDRFLRAETAFDRRFYRALAALLMIKENKDAAKMLP